MNLASLADHAVRTFLSLTQAHFLAEPSARLVSGVGDHYRLFPDRRQSTIWVGDQFPERPDKGEQKPVVVGRRGAMRWRFNTLGAGLAAMDIPAGTVEYSNLLQAAVVLQCASSKGLEAEALATELFQLVLAMERQIVRRSKIQQLWDLEIGEERPVEIKGAQIEWALVPLTITCMVQGSYGAGPASPEPLRGFDRTYDPPP